MTGTPDPSQDPPDRWLTDHHADIRHGLANFLDLDTGLREATLQGKHADLLGGLSGRLDIEAGLDAVRSDSSTPPSSSTTPKSEPSQPDIVTAIKATDPAARMALRHSPVIRAVILSDFLVRALDIEKQITEYAEPDDLTRIRGLANTLVRDLARAPDPASDRALDLAHDLARALDLAHDLAYAHDRARAAARDLAHAHALNLARALDLAHDLGPRALGLASALEVAREAALAAGRALGIQQMGGLAAALLDGVLDDFTDADLTDANLAETDLTGVRWSVSGTRWPSGTDVDALRARSREMAPDTGVYVVEAPGDGKESRHDVHV